MLKIPTNRYSNGKSNIGRIPQAIDDIEHGVDKHLVYTDCEDELPPRLDADFDSKRQLQYL